MSWNQFLFVFPAFKLLQHPEQHKRRGDVVAVACKQLLHPLRYIKEVIRIYDRVKVFEKWIFLVKCFEIVFNTETLMIVPVMAPYL